MTPTSTDELTTLVAEAQQATRHLDGELRLAAFERILDHLLANRTQPGSGRTEPLGDGVSAGARPDGTLADSQQRIDALARYFKIPPEDVQHIFEVGEGAPGLAIPTGNLPAPKAKATREIALLVAGARTALGLETQTSDIRAVVEDYGKYDSVNFMATLTDMSQISVLGKPRSPNRVLRMKVVGAEQAQGIAQRIIS